MSSLFIFRLLLTFFFSSPEISSYATLTELLSSACLRRSSDSLGHIISGITWGHWVFQILQHQTCSSKQPSTCQSHTDLCPSSICRPQFTPPDPQLSRSLFSCDVLDHLPYRHASSTPTPCKIHPCFLL